MHWLRAGEDSEPQVSPDERLLNALLRDAARVGRLPLPASDATLVEDCATFEALERQVHDVHGDGPAQDSELERLGREQDPLVHAIVGAIATAREGHQARARCLIAWDPDLIGPGAGDTGQRFLHALLRDLAGEGGE